MGRGPGFGWWASPTDVGRRIDGGAAVTKDMNRSHRDVADLVTSIAASGDDKARAASLIAGVIREGFDYRWTGIYEVGEHEIYALAWDGPHAPAYPRFPKTEGLCGEAVLSRAVVRVDDVTKDPNYLTTLDSTRSEVVVPVLTVKMEPVGLIDVESDQVGAFSEIDVAALQACASAMRPLWSS